MVRVKEIFSSIQGEGPYIGYKQIFIRLCGCNLGCKYCDTDFKQGDSTEYSTEELIEFCNNNSDCHSVSLTGGEPLLHTDFIKEFSPKCPFPVYLETNGTLFENLKEVIDDISFISADIKLPSATGLKPLWSEHEEFFKIASSKHLFAKTVFDKNITEEEISAITNLAKRYNIELIIQPMMERNKPAVSSDFMQNILDKCLNKYKKVRLIPQVHKFINVL